MLTEGYMCEGGFCGTIITDLQRVYACLAVKAANGETPSDMDYMSAVAKASFSTRGINPMSAQVEWRRPHGLRKICLEVQGRKNVREGQM